VKRIVRRTGPFVALAALAALCVAPAASAPRSASRAEGSVRVYLAPLSAESRRLSFRVVSLSAVSEAGETVPLEIALSEVSRASAGRERLLAVGSLPRGAFSGLLVEVEEARLLGEKGSSDLTLPEGPTRVPVSFRTSRKDAVVLSLELPFARAVVEGHRFEPAFEASVAPVSAIGLTALVTCRDSGTVAFFDKSTGRSFASVPVGREPSAVVIARELQRAYVALAGESGVAIIDLRDRTVLDRVPLGAGDEPEALALTPDGRTLLTANTGSGTVSFVDVGSRTEVDRVRVGENPAFLRIDPAGRRAYVINTLSDTIAVLDLGQRAVALTLSTDPGPLQGAFDRRGERFYVIHRSSPYLMVVDAAQVSPPQRVYLGPGATAVAVDRRSDRILVARSGRGEIEVYDPYSLLAVDTIPVSGEVSYLAVDLEENLLHAVLRREKLLRILRLSNRKPLADVDLGAEPGWVALMAER
jgi:YVTN family beta-propeller protein